MEPELECFDAQTHEAEGFGELKEGFLVRCGLKMPRKCMIFFINGLCSRRVFYPTDPNYFLLPLLGSRFPLDSATGVMGGFGLKPRRLSSESLRLDIWRLLTLRPGRWRYGPKCDQEIYQHS